MSNKVQLYLDPDDMHLAYIDDNGVPQHVLTDAFIKDGTILINDGYLEYKDENDNWHAVLGPNGEPVSLIGPEGPTGPKGDKGDQGEPGKVFSPQIDINGNLSWQLDRGSSTPNVINIKGENGFTPKIDIDSDGVLSISYKYDYVPSSEPLKVNIKGPKGEAGLTPKIELDNETGTLSVSYSSDFIPDASVLSMSIKGPRGEDGKTIVPHVSTEGLITWSLSAEIPVEPINIKGPKGNDGVGFETEFPANPKLGDTFIWGGESGLNASCFLGYVMKGQLYVYSQLPGKLGVVFVNEKSCLMPMHILMCVPLILLTDNQFPTQTLERGVQIRPLEFIDDNLVTTVTTIESEYTQLAVMSWDVLYGLADDQIKHLQPYIINIAKSIFGEQTKEYTNLSYPSKYALEGYLQGGALVCKYSDLLEEGTILNELYQQLCNNPSDIFNGIKQAVGENYNANVYLIPILPLSEKGGSAPEWVSQLPSTTTGWVPNSSVLHNGFDTNKMGVIKDLPSIEA